MKAYSFFFHYNKPASKSAGKPVLSFHYQNICYMVDAIQCNVPIKSKNNKRQPFCVMVGKAKDCGIKYISGQRIMIVN